MTLWIACNGCALPVIAPRTSEPALGDPETGGRDHEPACGPAAGDSFEERGG